MISGRVIQHEAVISLDVRGPTGRTVHVEGVIDTGSTDWLTLRRSDIDNLLLPWESEVDVILADGKSTTSDVYSGEVTWDGRPMLVPIVAAEGKPLVGMSLMNNYRLTLDVIDGGNVTLVQIGEADN